MNNLSAIIAFVALLLSDLPVDRLEEHAQGILDLSEDQEENEGFDMQSSFQVAIAEHITGMILQAESNVVEYRNSKPQGDPV